ncbi:MAG: GumC family protein [Rhizomicrobium sp.]
MSAIPTTANAATAQGETGRPFGFSDVARLLRTRWRVVRNVALGVVALTVLVLAVWPSRYSSTAVVMLDQRRNNFTDRSAVLSGLPTDPASVQNQIQILTSRDLAAQVIARLRLDEDREFNAARAPFPFDMAAAGLTPDAQRSLVIDDFLKHLSAESEGLSTAVSVSFSAQEPEKSARITNAVVDAYVGSQVRQKADAARRTTAWLESRIAQLSRQVQAADSAVQIYKAKNDLNDSGQGTQSLVDQQLAAINTQLVQARADLAEKQATYAHVESLVKSGRADDVSQVVASPLMVQLREQQADAIRNQADFASRYGPKHPKLLAVESQLRDLNGKVEQEADRIAGSVQNDVAVADAQVQSLQASLARARAQSNMQNFARVKLRALEAAAASTRNMYESFVTRFREAQDQGAVDTPDARIISHASVPVRPSSPPRALAVCASIPVGLLLGLLCALTMERAGFPAQARLRDVIPGKSPVPVLGTVPGALAPLAADQIVTDRDGAFARAMFALAGRLANPTAAAAPRVILVSGTNGREGRANVAVGLARALAIMERRVILIDADFASGSAAWTMGLEAGRSGLSDVVNGRHPLAGAAAKDVRSPALILAGGTALSQDAAIWTAQETRDFLGHLRKACDFVLIDAPADAGTPGLAEIVDAVLLVGTRASAARLKQAAAFLAGVPLCAIVLTR